MKLMQRTLLGFFVTDSKIDKETMRSYFKDPDKFRVQFQSIIDHFFPEGIPMDDLEDGIKHKHVKDINKFTDFCLWFVRQFDYECAFSKKTGNYIINLKNGSKSIKLDSGEHTALMYLCIKFSIENDSMLKDLFELTPGKWFGESKIGMEDVEVFETTAYDYEEDDDEDSEDDTVRIGTF